MTENERMGIKAAMKTYAEKEQTKKHLAARKKSSQGRRLVSTPFSEEVAELQRKVDESAMIQRQEAWQRSIDESPLIKRQIAEKEALQAKINAYMDRTERMAEKEPESSSSLKVSQPHDPAEKEADRMADTVIKMSDTAIEAGTPQQGPLTTVQTQSIPRALDKEQDDHEKDQEKDEEDTIVTRQRKAYANNQETSKEIFNRIEHLGKGQTLSSQERSFYEPRFGADFSKVRIHTDHGAAQTAEAINAKAYTKGNSIVFAPGEYQPDSENGKHLMAHELAHVVQANGTNRMLQRQAFNNYILPGIYNQQLPLTDEQREEALAYNATHLHYFKKDYIYNFFQHGRKLEEGSSIVKTNYSYAEETRFLYYITGLQQEQGLNVDGKVGPLTLQALESAGMNMSLINIGVFKHELAEQIQKNLTQNKRYLQKRKEEYLGDTRGTTSIKGVTRLKELKQLDTDILQAANAAWKQYEYVRRFNPSIELYINRMLQSSGTEDTTFQTTSGPARHNPQVTIINNQQRGKEEEPSSVSSNSLTGWPYFNLREDGVRSFLSARALFESLNSLRGLYPELGILRKDDLHNESDREIKQLVTERFDDIIDAINDMSNEIDRGTFPLEKMDLSIASLLQTDPRYRGDTRIRREVADWVAREASRERTYSYIGTGITIGLTVAAILAAPFSGGASLFLALGGSVAGLTSSAYNYERAEDLYNASLAGRSKHRFLSDPEEARFNYYMALLDLTLSIADFCLAAKGAKQALAAKRLQSLSTKGGISFNRVVRGSKGKSLDEIKQLVAKIRGQVDDSVVEVSRKGIRLSSGKLYEHKESLLKSVLGKLRKNDKMLSSDLDELMEYTKEGLFVKKLPSDKEISQLARTTQVEWSYSTNGHKVLVSGQQKEVKIMFDNKSTKYVAHTHFHNELPSFRDVEFFVTMLEQGTPVKKMGIIINGRTINYDVKALLKNFEKIQKYKHNTVTIDDIKKMKEKLELFSK